MERIFADTLTRLSWPEWPALPVSVPQNDRPARRRDVLVVLLHVPVML